MVHTILSVNPQLDQQKDKKKNAGITGGSGASSRSKDKKKENHATPMETSDEESQAMDTMGKSIFPHRNSELICIMEWILIKIKFTDNLEY